MLFSLTYKNLGENKTRQLLNRILSALAPRMSSVCEDITRPLTHASMAPARRTAFNIRKSLMCCFAFPLWRIFEIKRMIIWT